MPLALLSQSAAGTGSNTIDNLIGFATTVCVGIAILALIFFTSKDVISYLKGQGVSITSILAKIGATILIVALLFGAKNFYNNGNNLSTSTDKLTTDIINDINKGVGGAGK